MVNFEIIQAKLLSYQCKTVLEQENALKEIIQEIALMALSRAGFFNVAAFQGGTCLRILYGLDRFSEDLDFILEKENPNFDWAIYIENMEEEFSSYGYSLEVKTKNTDKIVKKTFLKADSLGGILLLKDPRTNRPRMQIKLEIDTRPPAGSTYDLKYLDFPLAYSIKTQDLPSLFAGKMHALLCRDYVKGRDWYDFLWYVARQVHINFELLGHALHQTGPWKNQNPIVTMPWLEKTLKAKIATIDWDEAKQDVSKFLRPREMDTLSLWSKDFFITRLSKLTQLYF